MVYVLQCFEHAQAAERVPITGDLSVWREVDASPALRFNKGTITILTRPLLHF